MATGLSKARKVKTLKEVKDEFRRSGKTARAWAKEHGFSEALVYMVMGGHRKGLRGQSHNIAVRLGVKDGVIVED